MMIDESQPNFVDNLFKIHDLSDWKQWWNVELNMNDYLTILIRTIF